MNDAEKYSDLMRRYELIFADWLRRVSDPMPGLELYGTGVVLGRRGQLRVTALDRRTNLVQWELSIEEGDTQVRITFPDKTTYLV